MMRRWCALCLLAAAISGCGGDDDDVAEVKTPLEMEKVSAAVMKTAASTAPGYTFFIAYEGTYQGKRSIELKGKSKSGKIVELEISPDGTLLGTE